MKRLHRVSYFLAAFVLGSGGLLALVNRAGVFEVSRVPIELVTGAGESGKPRAATMPEIRLKERLEGSLRFLQGKRVWDVDLPELRASLARDEWVKDVLISRSLPNEIRVRVRPKRAVFLMLDRHGAFVPVTEENALLGSLGSSAVPDVPFLRGDIFSNDSLKREAAVKFMLSLSDRGPLSRRNVSEMTWNNEDGFVLTLVQPRVEVKLGDDRIDLKAMRVAQVLNYLSVNDLKGRVIDASFSKKVLVRLRKGS